MNSSASKNISANYWIRVVVALFVSLCLSEIASAQPGYDRTARENTVDIHDTLLNFAKMGDKGMAEEMSAGISRTTKERHKRLSDQRRAELETLMALSKMTGKLVNVIRGGRQLQPTKTEREKRSVFDMNVKNLQRLFRLSQKLGYKGNAAFPVISWSHRIMQNVLAWIYLSMKVHRTKKGWPWHKRNFVYRFVCETIDESRIRRFIKNYYHLLCISQE